MYKKVWDKKCAMCGLSCGVIVEKNEDGKYWVSNCCYDEVIEVEVDEEEGNDYAW